MFDNDDFGYYKVTVERPDRRKAEFRDDLIETLRFDKSLSEVMAHLYAEHGEQVYEKNFLKSQEKEILTWCEENDITLNTKAKTKLFSTATWVGLKELVDTAYLLKQKVGTEEYRDFNRFREDVDAVLKAQKVKLGAPEKKAILNAVSWYDETAEKVIKKVAKLTGTKLEELLERCECELADLPDFGYFPTGKANEFTTYESSSDLRDSESIPVKQSIYEYFLDEVKPHVEETWLNIDSVKIGYEISFNKHFYRHKPLRCLDVVAGDIIQLERQAEGLIAEILGVKVPEVQGESA